MARGDIHVLDARQRDAERKKWIPIEKLFDVLGAHLNASDSLRVKLLRGCWYLNARHILI